MRRAALIVMLLLVASKLVAARAANAYPKTFSWRGESALRIARFFGVDTSRPSTLRLRESYELYRRDETRHDDWLTDGPKSRLLAPPVYVTLRFSPGPAPRLTLEGMFFDGGSSIPEIRPRFFFTSAFVPERGAVPEGWQTLFHGAEETRSANAPEHDVTAQVIRTSDYDAPQRDPGFLIRVQIADR